MQSCSVHRLKLISLYVPTHSNWKLLVCLRTQAGWTLPPGCWLWIRAGLWRVSCWRSQCLPSSDGYGETIRRGLCHVKWLRHYQVRWLIYYHVVFLWSIAMLAGSQMREERKLKIVIERRIIQFILASTCLFAWTFWLCLQDLSRLLL